MSKFFFELCIVTGTSQALAFYILRYTQYTAAGAAADLLSGVEKYACSSAVWRQRQ